MTENQNRPSEPSQTPDNKEPDNRLQLSPDKNISPNPKMPDSQKLSQITIQDYRQIKSARTMIMIANIAGPISLFIGGVFLGTVGFICAFLAYRKLSTFLKKAAPRSATQMTVISHLRRSSIIGMVICGTAFALNAFSLYLLYPELNSLLSGSAVYIPSTTWG